jgi:putative ABC transport system permease protein
MKGQVFAIAMVIVSGVGTFVMLKSTMQSLNTTRDKFYREFDFADAFVSLKRAPESLKQRIMEIPGINQIETRVVADVKLDIKGFPEPVTAKIVSLPEDGEPILNRLFIRKGRLIEPEKDNEVVVSEAFAEAHGFRLQDSFGAIINGRWKKLSIVGIALSPEFVLQARQGAITPDYKRYAILWMARDVLAVAYDMEGAFNDVALKLSPGINEEDIFIQVDNLLDDYGGLGTYSRKYQISHRFLSEEFRQLQRSSEIFPSIFIVVAAFLLNVVISRTVSIQREQIATLKAFGYSNADIGIHYIKMIFLVVIIGIVGGTAVGVWLGKALSSLYMEFYRFPYLIYELRPSVVITASIITAASAIAGTLHAVWKASSLPPAEALRPEMPSYYRKTIIERIGLWHFISQPGKIIIRNITRRPVKSFLTITGISLACAIMIAGTFAKDAVDFMVNVQFKLTQKEDMTVTFNEPASRKSVFELKGIRGVEHAEGFRSVPVRLRFNHINYRTSIQGIEADNKLHTLLDTNLKPFILPPAGLVLSDYLSTILGAGPGDLVTMEVLEGNRPKRQVPVVGIVKQYIGTMGYMNIKALNQLMREGSTISGAYLSADSLYQNDIFRKLIEMPGVAGTVVRKDEISNFYETQAEAFLFFTFVASILAGTIAFGVVYNSARIALSERSRELASLRVLGYTRAEISYIFLGELGLLTAAAIPLGFIFGKGLCVYIAGSISSDLFRVPAVVEPSTYSLAATVVVVSALLSGIIVRHNLDHLNLVAVLKLKE